jgi:hypothetical protein
LKSDSSSIASCSSSAVEDDVNCNEGLLLFVLPSCLVIGGELAGLHEDLGARNLRSVGCMPSWRSCELCDETEDENSTEDLGDEALDTSDPNLSWVVSLDCL